MRLYIFHRLGNILNRNAGLERISILLPSIKGSVDHGLSAIVSNIRTFPMMRKFLTECCVAIVEMWLASPSSSAWTPELAYLDLVRLWMVTYSR